MFNSFGFNRFLNVSAERCFHEQYRCYSVSMLPEERPDIEKGGKIIMPPSALHTLTRLNTTYPMLFKLTNSSKNRNTHCGVLEFIAEEGRVYLPYWMMKNLLIDQGDMLQIQSVSLPVATYGKFQAHSLDFLNITDPKAVLESGLRNFACITKGDVIAINYNQKVFELSVLETKPSDACSIIECDLNVEFEAPIGYEEHKNQQHDHSDHSDNEMTHEEMLADIMPKNKRFSGTGNRIDGKSSKAEIIDEPVKFEYKRGIPDYNYQLGEIRFHRNFKYFDSKDNSNDDPVEMKPFEGSGQTLSTKKK